MKSTKILALLLVFVMCFSMLVACKKPDTKPEDKPGTDPGTTVTPEAVKDTYTYYSWTTSLGNNWNPHTWETSGDSGIMGYIETPLVDLAPLDTEEGTYQWVYLAAESIKDVTAQNQGDLTKYGAILPEGKTPADITESYVYEIKLNPNMKWENGDPINADTYVYSMQQLLNSKMRNYRANNYVDGNSAIAGAMGYYNSEAPIYKTWLASAESYASEYGVDADGYATVVINGEPVNIYTTFSGTIPFFGSNSMNAYGDAGYADAGYFSVPVVEELDYDNLPDYIEVYDEPVQAKDENGEPLFDADGNPVYVQAKDENGDPIFDEDGNPVYETAPVYYTNVYYKYYENEDPYGVIKVTPEMIEEFKYVALIFGDTNPVAWNEFFLHFTGYGDKVEYDTVGLYKVDEYTIHYVCMTAYELNYFLTSCTSNWIVHEATYEANKKEEGGMIVTTYGTSMDKSMSYGPYKLSNFEDGKQVVFVQNENWYGFEKDADGNLVSYADFEVDGEYLQQYVTSKVVIDVMTQEAAYQAFLKGELTDYAPTAQELLQYATSERLYKVDETYTMRWFFNTNVQKLKALDEGANNENSVVISNYNFRKAMSLAIDRADFVTATEGWQPAYSLMNSLYHYDIYNDPTSSYRSSDEAMQAIVDLYGVKYGPNEVYKTLAEAYENITGYNLTEAKALMKQAYTELTTPDENGNVLYNGGDIVIEIGWAKGALTDADKAQVVLLNKYLNAALEGSGFGKITFVARDNITDRYGDTAAGKYAIGWGAWGGAAFYPFTMFRVYMDPGYTKIHEAGCWNPATEELELTFTVEGETVTDKMTWQNWSKSMDGVGKYANASNETKLQITALLEKEYLNLYYCIPMAGTTICTLLSYQVDEYTENYNIMYGFGGLRFMKWNFTDAEWADYVAEQGGTLNYK